MKDKAVGFSSQFEHAGNVWIRGCAVYTARGESTLRRQGRGSCGLPSGEFGTRPRPIRLDRHLLHALRGSYRPFHPVLPDQAFPETPEGDVRETCVLTYCIRCASLNPSLCLASGSGKQLLQTAILDKGLVVGDPEPRQRHPRRLPA
eukprot:2792741-Rhodomonas_salina.1